MAASQEERPVVRMAGKIADLPRLFHGERGYRILSSWLGSQRWFAGKSKKIISGDFSDYFSLGVRENEVFFGGFLNLHYESGEGDSYFIPLSFSRKTSRTLFPLGTLEFDDGSGVLEDGLLIPEMGQTLLKIFFEKQDSAALSVQQTSLFPTLARTSDLDILPRVLSGEQSNTSLLFGRSLIMKCYRRPEKGGNCDFEMGAFFSSRTLSLPVAPLLGALCHSPESGGSIVIALLSGFVENRGDAWSWLLKAIDPDKVVENFHSGQKSLLDKDVIRLVKKIGASTGLMHRCLSEESFSPEMAPVPFLPEDWELLGRSVLAMGRDVFPEGSSLPPSWWPDHLLGFEEASRAFWRQIPDFFSGPMDGDSADSWGGKIRCHGDYHLGQLLVTSDLDIVVIDFEGEPSVPISVRREKRSPLSDVAGMVRSLDYLSKMIFPDFESRAVSKALFAELSLHFLDEYQQEMAGAGELPSGGAYSRLLKACLLRKAFYELSYEINNRPDWCHVPLAGILELL